MKKILKILNIFNLFSILIFNNINCDNNKKNNKNDKEIKIYKIKNKENFFELNKKINNSILYKNKKFKIKENNLKNNSINLKKILKIEIKNNNIIPLFNNFSIPIKNSLLFLIENKEQTNKNCYFLININIIKPILKNKKYIWDYDNKKNIQINLNCYLEEKNINDLIIGQNYVEYIEKSNQFTDLKNIPDIILSNITKNLNDNFQIIIKKTWLNIEYKEKEDYFIKIINLNNTSDDLEKNIWLNYELIGKNNLLKGKIDFKIWLLENKNKINLSKLNILENYSYKIKNIKNVTSEEIINIKKFFEKKIKFNILNQFTNEHVSYLSDYIINFENLENFNILNKNKNIVNNKIKITIFPNLNIINNRMEKQNKFFYLFIYDKKTNNKIGTFTGYSNQPTKYYLGIIKNNKMSDELFNEIKLYINEISNNILLSQDVIGAEIGQSDDNDYAFTFDQDYDLNKIKENINGIEEIKLTFTGNQNDQNKKSIVTGQCEINIKLFKYKK